MTGKKELTEWTRVNAHGKLAEICCQYLRKGSLVYIEGNLRTRKYEKDGVDHYATEVKADQMRMLDKRQDGQQGAPSQNQGNPPHRASERLHGPRRRPNTHWHAWLRVRRHGRLDSILR